MEKFSTWRDAGTGIQPFLTPMSPVQESSIGLKIYQPFGYVIAVMRLILLGIVLLIHMLGTLVGLLIPVPPLKRLAQGAVTALCSRLALLILGFWWIPVETVNRKRGRGSGLPENWNPSAGDIIVSNWASWIELLWLSFRWNPIFVLPVVDQLPVDEPRPATPQKATPGRRTGTGSAAISTPPVTSGSQTRTPVVGFVSVSLLSMVRHTGMIPFTRGDLGSDTPVQSLGQIRSSANRPLVIFPECTTSNGRALLRFADIFQDIQVPVKKFKVFVMCVRYDPPTSAAPSLSHSIPTNINPLPHLLTILSAPTFSQTISIRLLAPSDSPSSGSFVASEFIAPGSKDLLGEACAQLISQLGKIKRTSVQGWEEKVAFLSFYRSKAP